MIAFGTTYGKRKKILMIAKSRTEFRITSIIPKNISFFNLSLYWLIFIRGIERKELKSFDMS
ncbi:hypothetical protein BLOT_014276 [Blomia tropicalis]|nr:hypothetical protein BLOT_014276 [Blomia tropicalis]